MPNRSFTTPNIDIRIEALTRQLQQALESPNLTHAEIVRSDKQGLYLIASQEGIIYVGKTTRSGKLRMQELAADFRSHTLNRKLLSEYLRTLGLQVTTLTSGTNAQWIAAAILTSPMQIRGVRSRG